MRSLISIFIILFVCFFATLFPMSANAHKIRIFAWPEGKIIHGETAFSGDKGCQHVQISVLDEESHAILLSTQTDEQGKFNFSVPEQAIRNKTDLIIVVNSEDGHRAEWSMSADEYLQPKTENEFASNDATTANDRSGGSPALHLRPNSSQFDEEKLRRIIGEELEKKLAPLKYEIVRTEDKPDLRDIIGGIGYIIGLAGILAWIKSRSRQNEL